MTAYYVAGKADDPSFAWVENVAQLITLSFPHVCFRMEMKHPEEWKSFVTSVFRKYDFSGFDDNFQGPLIWTPEGHLVGRAADFVQQIYTEKFKLTNPPMVTEERFRKIAKDNMAEVQAQRLRLKNGPGFAEKLQAADAAAQEAGALEPPEELVAHRVTELGVALELRVSQSLAAAHEASRARASEAEAGDAVPPVCLVAELGQERSHHCLLHPRPLAAKHVALVPRRLSEAGEEALRVLPRALEQQGEEALGQDDFAAAAEVLLSGVPDAAVGLWLGMNQQLGGHLQSLDTHLQVLPEGLRSEAEPAYPTALYAERLRGGKASEFGLLRAVRHAFLPLEGAQTANELCMVLLKAYEKATLELRDALGSGAGALLAFTAGWLLLLPLRAPAEGSGFEQSAWQKLPPPHPCALLGVVICPVMELTWPEVAEPGKPGATLVSSRAQLEGIPESAASFAAAEADVRISGAFARAAPLEVLRYWAYPA